jgi:hypothetical protein
MLREPFGSIVADVMTSFNQAAGSGHLRYLEIDVERTFVRFISDDCVVGIERSPGFR